MVKCLYACPPPLAGLLLSSSFSFFFSFFFFLYLSSKDSGTPSVVGKVLMQSPFVWTTAAYVIWPAAARTLLRMLPLDMPVDNSLAWHTKQG